MLIDWHTHLSSYTDIDGALRTIRAERILSVACSVDAESYIETRALARGQGFVIPTFGVHPAKSGSVRDLASLDPYLDESRIIGEIGLDDFWVKDVSQAVQEPVFEYMLDHCDRRGKYCVIHTKGAEARIADMLGHFPGCRPIIHWYSGPKDLLIALLDLGCLFTFGLELHYSDHIAELLDLVPPDRLLSETDNPGSEPWLGGNTDSPRLIERVVREIASRKGMRPLDMENLIWRNSMRILRESGVEADLEPSSPRP
ncbi:MAG TPA: TatD family hydrolase [Rectinemataceae bacterium]|nr:TatD family hydrolase [Rectinemataceae bacterium]